MKANMLNCLLKQGKSENHPSWMLPAHIWAKGWGSALAFITSASRFSLEQSFIKAVETEPTTSQLFFYFFGHFPHFDSNIYALQTEKRLPQTTQETGYFDVPLTAGGSAQKQFVFVLI